MEILILEKFKLIIGILMQNRHYIYISGMMNNPVIKSQVLNWLEILQKEGIVFDLMCCIPLHYLLMNWKSELRELIHYNKVLRGKIYIVPIWRSKTKYNPISTIIKGLFLYWYSIIKNSRYDSVLIQTRSYYNLPAIQLIKRVRNNIKVVYDMRGSASAEFLNSFGYNSVEELKLDRLIRKHRRIIDFELNMVNSSDITFCVSNNLKQYIVSQTTVNNTDKLKVIPGAADKKVFYYDPDLREKTRQRLGLVDKQVFVYCGRLTHYWHKSELIFEYASAVLRLHPDTFFVCLTRDLDKAQELIATYYIDPNKILCKYSDSPSEINEIYNAAEFGILFRDNIVTNKVSSPTKLAEYLLSGLPVLISMSVGDYSDIVSTLKFGAVTSNDLSELLAVTTDKFYKGINRKKISEYASQHLSKQAIVESIIEAYSALDRLYWF